MSKKYIPGHRPAPYRERAERVLAVCAAEGLPWVTLAERFGKGAVSAAMRILKERERRAA